MRTTGWRAVLSLLLLLALPLGQLYRAATGGCQRTASTRLASDIQEVAAIELARSPVAAVAWASAIIENAHEHDANGIALAVAAAGACGPAAFDGYAGAAEMPRPLTVSTPWRMVAPTQLAAPPPAPPPRLN